MKSIKLDIATTPSAVVSINWLAYSKGLNTLTEKCLVNMLTDLGSDISIPTRGTQLTQDVTASGVFSASELQHALNFSVIEASDVVKNYSTSDASTNLASLSASYGGLSDDGLRAKVYLSATNALGQQTNSTISL